MDAVQPRKEVAGAASVTGQPTTPEGKAPAPGSAAEAEQRRLKLKLKVDGAEEAWEGTEEDVARELQISKAARKRMQEAAEQRKAMDQFLADLKRDPISALKNPNIGVDVKEMVKQQLLEEYEAEQLKAQDPREYELRELKRKLEAREAEDQKMREEQEAQRKHQEMEQMVAHERGRLQKLFMTALDKTSLPQSEHTLAEMASIYALNLNRGLDLTPEEIVQEVEERFNTNAQRYLSNLKGEQLAKRLGEDVVKEVLRYSLEKARGAKAQKAHVAEPPKPVVAPRDTDTYKRPTTMTPKQMQNLFKSRVR